MFVGRRQLIAIASVASVVLLLLVHAHFDDRSPVHRIWRTPEINSRPTLNAGNTIIFEEYIHDEVTGSLAYSLALVGVNASLHSAFRMGFPDILEEFLPYTPERNPPNVDVVNKMIEEGKIDNLVLTTCKSSLPKFKETLLKSPPTTRILCVVHHGGGDFTQMKGLMREFAASKQLVLLTLSDHVQHVLWDETQRWQELDPDGAVWESLPIETFLPVFQFPPEDNKTYVHDRVFPTEVMIQGNIEPGRRNYQKVIDTMEASMEREPETWGYSLSQSDGHTVYTPLEGRDPFQLHLIGKRNPQSGIIIPPGMDGVVIHVTENAAYHDYYQMLADADLLIPAFQSWGNLQATASSSMAAGLIVRTPILVTERYQESYPHVSGPAAVLRNSSEAEMDAIAGLRRESIASRPSPHAEEREVRAHVVALRHEEASKKRAWKEHEDRLQDQNMGLWWRVLARKEEVVEA